MACFAAVLVALMILKPCGYLPDACFWIGIGAIALVLLSLGVGDALRTRAQLRRLTMAELEGRVWRYEPEYFDFLGNDEPSVVEFRRIVEGRNLADLSRRWRDLERAFCRLEGKAGHRGRPLIMDYYLDQSQAPQAGAPGDRLGGGERWRCTAHVWYQARGGCW